MYILKNKLTEHHLREVQKILRQKFIDTLEENNIDDDEYYAYMYFYDNFVEQKINEAIDIYLKQEVKNEN